MKKRSQSFAAIPRENESTPVAEFVGTDATSAQGAPSAASHVARKEPCGPTRPQCFFTSLNAYGEMNSNRFVVLLPFSMKRFEPAPPSALMFASESFAKPPTPAVEMSPAPEAVGV